MGYYAERDLDSGVVGIFKKWKACMDSIGAVKLSHEHSFDYKVLYLRLNVERTRLQNWGTATGIAAVYFCEERSCHRGGPIDHLHQKLLQKSILRILTQIESAFQRSIFTRTSIILKSSRRQRNTKDDTSPAIYDLETLQSIVLRVRNSLDDLNDTIPALSISGPRFLPQNNPGGPHLSYFPFTTDKIQDVQALLSQDQTTCNTKRNSRVPGQLSNPLRGSVSHGARRPAGNDRLSQLPLEVLENIVCFLDILEPNSYIRSGLPTSPIDLPEAVYSHSDEYKRQHTVIPSRLCRIRLACRALRNASSRFFAQAFETIYCEPTEFGLARLAELVANTEIADHVQSIVFVWRPANGLRTQNQYHALVPKGTVLSPPPPLYQLYIYQDPKARAHFRRALIHMKNCKHLYIEHVCINTDPKSSLRSYDLDDNNTDAILSPKPATQVLATRVQMAFSWDIALTAINNGDIQLHTLRLGTQFPLSLPRHFPLPSLESNNPTSALPDLVNQWPPHLQHLQRLCISLSCCRHLNTYPEHPALSSITCNAHNITSLEFSTWCLDHMHPLITQTLDLIYPHLSSLKIIGSRVFWQPLCDFINAHNTTLRRIHLELLLLLPRLVAHNGFDELWEALEGCKNLERFSIRNMYTLSHQFFFFTEPLDLWRPSSVSSTGQHQTPWLDTVRVESGLEDVRQTIQVFRQERDRSSTRSQNPIREHI